MPYGFGYYDNVSVYDYNNNYNNFIRQPYYQTNNWDNLVVGAGVGAGLGYLLGFSPLLGFGLGALLSNNGAQNTNIVNINTGRRGFYNGMY
jgi:hypothetical protein